MSQSMSSRFNHEIEKHNQYIAGRIGCNKTRKCVYSTDIISTGYRTSGGEPNWLKTDCLPDELRQAITSASVMEVILMLCDGNLLLPEMNTLLLQTAHTFAWKSVRFDICTAISSLWGIFDKCNMKKTYFLFFRSFRKDGENERFLADKKLLTDCLLESLQEWITIVDAIKKNDSSLFSNMLTADFTRTHVPVELALSLYSVADYYVAYNVVIDIMGNVPGAITTSMLQKYPVLIEKF